ncbi:MAG: 23S rRNA (guanosine(2251)-2'-O)-methyltransferase RlmB [Bacilli bacterium]|nr:23S rRNA (guanosine(2251)-2'-O)-methyltransferase RlmB [Bacilli bacterium]MDY6430597.1 23S rRNA (guanosine(2251)-2'-O)-methyltransferase RlmB [Bacilli bacterium]
MNILIYSKNTIREALRAKVVKKLYVSNKNRNDPLVKLATKELGDIVFLKDEELTKLAKNSLHQGFVAEINEFEVSTLEEIVANCKNKENPLILILDGIEDPHNLGAILRSADAFGVDGIILKNRGEVPLNSTVARVSTGAVFHLNIAPVTNLNRSIDYLKKNGFWIVASDGEAKLNYDEIDYKGPIGIIVGSEGFGISKLLLSNSDFIVKIPMVGHVNSLNASVASAIMLAMVSHLRK